MFHHLRTLAVVLSFALLVPASKRNIHHDVFAYKNTFKAKADHHRLANALAAHSTSPALNSPVKIINPALLAASPSFQIYTNATLPTHPAPSAACSTALTSSLACNFTIQYMTYTFDDPSLSAMCTSTCSTALTTYRKNVASACSAFKFSGPNNSSYLATRAVDTISEPYFSQCRTDTATGHFCADVLATFTTTNPSAGILGYPQTQLCSSCMLGLLNTTLSSPITFSNALYDTLQSALKTCGTTWTSYNVTPPNAASQIFTPGPVTQPLGSNTTNNAICLLTGRNVTLTASGTCQAVAKQFSVTQQDILGNNPTLRPANCTAGIASGAKLCLPQTCTLYTVQANQTCDALVSDVNTRALIGNRTLTVAQLESFNPSLDSACLSLSNMDTVCIAPHGGFPTLGNDGGIAVPTQSPTAVAAPPGQTAPGTTAKCGSWYLVQTGNFCQQVALNNSITLADLITLNPEINTNCTNLWANYYYCVAPFPPFNQASSAPFVTANFSRGAVSTIAFTTAATQTPLPVLTSYTGMPAPTNLADGSITNGCGYYYNVESTDNCTSVETYFNISDTDFQKYNQNPTKPCPTLSAGSAVCVQVLNAAATIPPRPSNAATGSAPNGCSRWYTIASGDGCPSVETKFGLSPSQFFGLNPELNTNCTNLGLNSAYCVRAIGQVSAPVPTNAATGTDNNDCAKYDTVISGDSCPIIEKRNNITDSLFRALNPEINAACTNIQLNVAYCVAAIPGFTATTSAPTGTPTPTNVATGTDTKDCTKYDTVISGDTCPIIEKRNNVTDSLFRALNPEINAACTNIQLNVAYCVQAVPGFTTTTTTTTTAAGTKPTNIATGSWTNCTTYYNVVSGDSCAKIDTQFAISFSDFERWNPEINAACNNLQLASYCVKMTPACTKIYTVASGDSCGKIETAFTLTDAVFRSLNPWLDTACDIQLGQNMCVSK